MNPAMAARVELLDANADVAISEALAGESPPAH
jgi:hypothetical protein